MLASPFVIIMVVTFVAAAVTLMLGVFTLSTPGNASRSNTLMRLRVMLCALLLLEILVYVTIIKP